MQAHLLTLNDFGMPRVHDASDAAYIHIVYILLLEPGTFQSHPTMGVGLRSRYRYNNDESMLTDLKNEITRQIAAYLPELTGVDVSIGLMSSHTLAIVINTDDGAYTLTYDSEEDNLDVGTTYILDDLLSQKGEYYNE